MCWNLWLNHRLNLSIEDENDNNIIYKYNKGGLGGNDFVKSQSPGLRHMFKNEFKGKPFDVS